MIDLDPVQLAGYRTPEAKVLRKVLSKLVAALPHCRCGEVATHRRTHGLHRNVCVSCRPRSRKREGDELPWGNAAKRAGEVLFVLDEVDRRASD